mgnify:CR=1 FL=1
MIEFEVSHQLRHGLSDAVWVLVKDVASMPRYWGGHREVVILSSEGCKVTFRVRFAFPGPNNVGLAQAQLDDYARQLRIDYLKGPVVGHVEVKVSEDSIVTRWRVRVPWYMRLVEPWLRRHFKGGARNALERLVEAAEASASNDSGQAGIPSK